MKKYIIPLVFLFTLFFLIPKGAYYKKENLTIKIQTENKIQGNLQIKYPLGYEMEKYYRNILGEKELCIKIKNTIVDYYILNLRQPKSEIKRIAFINGEKEVSAPLKNKQTIFYDKIASLYSLSILNILLYICLIIGMSKNIFIKGIELDSKKIGVLSLTFILMAISINIEWLSKALAIFYLLTLFRLYKNYKKIRFGILEIGIFLLLILSFLSEFENIKNYSNSFQYFQNTLMCLICVRIWNFNEEDQNDVKSFFKVILYLLALINMISPLVMGGIYSFTFGILMTILACWSLEEITLEKRIGKIELLKNIFSFLIGLNGVIVSSRRTMLVAIIIYIIYLGIKLLLKKRNTKIFVVFILVNVLITCLFLGKKDRLIKNELLSIVNLKTDNSNIQRILMWRRGSYILKENMLLGIGVDSFYKESTKQKYNKIKSKNESFSSDFKHIHNEYLHQIITRGILGGIIFYSVWINLLLKLKNKKDKEFEIILIILYGVYGIFDSYSIRSESLIFYLFIGMSTINNLILEKMNKEKFKRINTMLVVLIFIVGLYFNKRFRYYFLIGLALFLIYLFYKKKKEEKNEKI